MSPARAGRLSGAGGETPDLPLAGGICGNCTNVNGKIFRVDAEYPGSPG